MYDYLLVRFTKKFSTLPGYELGTQNSLAKILASKMTQLTSAKILMQTDSVKTINKQTSMLYTYTYKF